MRFAFCGVVYAAAAIMCGCATTAKDNAADGAVLPQRFGDGWALTAPPSRFDESNLFDHINGEAELFYPYGFQLLTAGAYGHAEYAETSLLVDVYEMGSLLDAFGIYSNFRDPSADFVDIGAEAFEGYGQLMFYQDRYFVQITAMRLPETASDAPVLCAGAIAERLPGGAAEPTELGLLAGMSIEPHSTQYIGESLLGYAFFRSGLVAEAVLDDKAVRPFVVIERSAEAAANALNRYGEYLRAEGQKAQVTVTATGLSLRGRDPLYKGVAARQTGRYIAGVAGLAHPSDADAFLDQMAANARSY